MLVGHPGQGGAAPPPPSLLLPVSQALNRCVAIHLHLQVILGKEGQPIDLETYGDQLLHSCE